ncbi:Bax inhibitor-1 family protein [Lactobacillus iners]|uniref:Bax inhibitor-1/YccA family protein n=1 Tax=Lactobacillus iners TaxID=147802 RepID=UPI0001F13692|nr:Bax inhibitor-1/YccA family protein [Lactobacillus iners]EFU78169.1 hypothetical protein HMPREF9223_0784 [Lactobacillus iners ATCC 55195]MBW8449840.1 Bax inhibitor-1/YccA family protein [Lactobacillus iners]
MNNFENIFQTRRSIVDNVALNRFLTKMYSIVALAILVSAATAYTVLHFFANQFFNALSQNHALSFVLLILPFALIIGTSFSKNPILSFVLLMLTAMVYGLTFSIICLAFTQTSITAAFLSSSAVFITMAFIGTTTKKDLSNLGSYASAALIGLIVATIINMFLRNPMVTYIFSYISVVIFTILTAWDAQKMKNIFIQNHDEIATTSLAIIGALTLYLDFINLFIQFLQIFGFSDNRR